MLHIVDHQNRTREHQMLRSMFEARKRVFIDLLKWDLPALADRFELDHFDDEDATYLIVADPDGNHLASARLLLTTQPALLDTLFPDLVAGEVPQGSDILEITRFCLSPGIGARQRRTARRAAGRPRGLCARQRHRRLYRCRRTFLVPPSRRLRLGLPSTGRSRTMSRTGAGRAAHRDRRHYGAEARRRRHHHARRGLDRARGMRRRR